MYACGLRTGGELVHLVGEGRSTSNPHRVADLGYSGTQIGPFQ